MKVADVMTKDIVTVGPHTPIDELVDTMRAFAITALPVVEDGVLVGIVTATDLLPGSRGGAMISHPSAIVQVRRAMRGEPGWMRHAGFTADALMTKTVATASPDEPMEDVARRMLRVGRRHLPVVVDGRVVGMVSRTDLLAGLAEAFDREPTPA